MNLCSRLGDPDLRIREVQLREALTGCGQGTTGDDSQPGARRLSSGRVQLLAQGLQILSRRLFQAAVEIQQKQTGSQRTER